MSKTPPASEFWLQIRRKMALFMERLRATRVNQHLVNESVIRPLVSVQTPYPISAERGVSDGAFSAEAIAGSPLAEALNAADEAPEPARMGRGV